jgi:hypothetical protein
MNVWNLALAVEGDVVFEGGRRGELYRWLLFLVAKLTTFVSISLASLHGRKGVRLYMHSLFRSAVAESKQGGGPSSRYIRILGSNRRDLILKYRADLYLS